MKKILILMSFLTIILLLQIIAMVAPQDRVVAVVVL